MSICRPITDLVKYHFSPTRQVVTLKIVASEPGGSIQLARGSTWNLYLQLQALPSW